MKPKPPQAEQACGDGVRLGSVLAVGTGPGPSIADWRRWIARNTSRTTSQRTNAKNKIMINFGDMVIP
jgi:hypothetical protein